eukprot:Skav227295  [mRNA]  locus=scaffold2645:38903:49260:- [translate_table: standard]
MLERQCRTYVEETLIDDLVPRPVSTGSFVRHTFSRRISRSAHSHAFVEVDEFTGMQLFQNEPMVVSAGRLGTQGDASSSNEGPVVVQPQLPEVMQPTMFIFDSLPRIQLSWQQQAAVECLEEGPVAYYLTFYLSSLRHSDCRHGRAVRLLQSTREWRLALLEAWDDVFDYNEPAYVYLVTPQPVLGINQGRAGHLLVVQHPIASACAYHLTEIGTAEAPSYSAHLTPTQLHKFRVLHDADRSHDCMLPGYSCQVWHAGVEVQDEPLIGFDGIGVVLTIRRTRSNSSVCGPMITRLFHEHELSMPLADPFADTSRSSTPSRPSGESGTHLSPSYHVNHAAAVASIADEVIESVRQSRNAHALDIPVRQSAVSLADQESWIQELYSDWVLATTLHHDAPAVLHIASWYLDFENFHMCTASRLAILEIREFARWRARLCRVWQDPIDPNAAVDMVIVTPQPPPHPSVPGVVAHVLLFQKEYARPDARAVHFSIDINANKDQAAVVVSSNPTGRELLRYVELEGLCQRAACQACTVSHGRRTIPLQEVFDPSMRFGIRNGFSIQVLVSLNEDATDDTTTFLQSRTKAHQEANKIVHPTSFQPLWGAPLSFRAVLSSSGFEEDMSNFMQISHASASSERHSPAASSAHSRYCDVTDRFLPLLEVWMRRAFIEDDEQGPACYVETWFLDTVHVRECFVPRTVLLDAHLHNWEEYFRNAWRDHIDSTKPVHIIPYPFGSAATTRRRVIGENDRFHAEDGFGIYACLTTPPELTWQAIEADSLGVLDSPADDVQSLMQVPTALLSIATDDSSQLVWLGFIERLLDVCWSEMEVKTYYVSHANAPICTDPRLVPLTRDHTLWYNSFVNTWADAIDRNEPLYITLVDPVFRHPGVSGMQVIIWQHPKIDWVVVLEASCRDPLDARDIVQAAKSVPAQMLVNEVLQRFGTTSQYARMWFQSRPMDSRGFVALHDGACWTLEVHEGGGDEQAMMQLHHAVNSAPSTEPSPPEEPSAQNSCSHVVHGAFMHFLHAEIIRQLGDHDYGILVSFYLHHAMHRVCTTPRVTPINANAFDWGDRLEDTWRDMIVQDSPLAFYIVFPKPLDAAPAPACAYVLLVQGEAAHEKAVLFTHLHVSALITYQAACVPDSIDRIQALDFAGATTQCTPVLDNIRCEVLHANHKLSDGNQWATQNGHGFIVAMLQAPAGHTFTQVAQVQHGEMSQSATQDSEAAPSTTGRRELRLQSLLPFGANAPASGSNDPQTSVIHIESDSESEEITNRPRVPPSPVVLHLDDLLPPPSSPSGSYKLNVPGMHELAHRVFQPRHHLQLAIPDPDGMPIALAKALHFAECQASSQQDPAALEIYTDGSSRRKSKSEARRASWAYVVVLRFPDGTSKLLGWEAAAVTTDDDSNALPVSARHPETGRADAFAGESEALCRALLFALQYELAQAGLPVFLVSDALTVIRGTQAAWSITARPIVQKLLRPLFAALVQLTEVWPQWQKGHAGCLYNELADYLAGTYIEHEPLPISPHALRPDDLVLLPWLWMHVADAFQQVGFTVTEDQIQFPIPPPMTGCDAVLWPKNHDLPDVMLQVEAVMTTYNVTTLREWVAAPGQEMSWSSRTQLLQQQGRNNAILFLQETRARRTREWSNSNWFGFASAAERGQGGVEVWISKTVPFAHIGTIPVFFKADMCTVIAATPRTLLLKVVGQHFQCVLGSLHAPHEFSSEEQKESYWHELSEHLRPYAGWPCFFGMDANARLGSICDACVEGFRADDENQNGKFLHDLLQKHSLCLPSTMHSTVWTSPEDYGTWKSPAGWVRLDYIIIPVDWKVADPTMSIDDLALPADVEDHRSLTCRVQMQVCSGARFSKPVSRPAFNLPALRTAEGQQICASFLQGFQGHMADVGWKLPLDQLVVQLNEQTLSFLQKHFPLQRKSKRSDWISDHTWTLPSWSRSVRRAASRIRKLLSRQYTEPQIAEWMTMVCMARRKAFKFAQLAASTALWKAEIRAYQQQAGVCLSSPAEPASVTGFACQHCERIFACRKALATHQAKMHGFVAEVRRYMDHPTICPSCLRDFNNTQKLRQHLQREQNGCMPFLRTVLVPVSEAEAASMETVQQPKGVYRPPIVQAYGPFLPSRLQWEAVAPHRPADESGSDPPSEPGFVERVTTTEKDAQSSANTRPSALSPFRGKFAVLYFYAGHSRPGDMKQCFAELSMVYNLDICVLLIDIIYDRRWCDLTSPHARKLWSDIVGSGCLLGLIGSPPCETWSVARWLGVLRNDGGPMPIRDRRHPWGLKTATLKQMSQLHVANSLIQAFLSLATLACACGTAWLMEHPAEPSLREAASIWKVEAMQVLFSLGAKRHLVLQGLYGACSAKPTGFATRWLPAFEEALLRWRDTRVQPSQWQSLTGKDMHGAWKTAQAKAYPWRVNMAIAESFFQRAIVLTAQPESPPGTEFGGLEGVFDGLMHAVNAGATMGPDFAGETAS